ncbi:MAG TPA: ATP-binding protein [Chthoniobacterales bacterium]|nr:ATP-binding protein [Chthoniobacterales bacterium]
MTTLWLILWPLLFVIAAGTALILRHHLVLIRRAIRRLALEQEITATGSRPAIVREIYHDLHQIAHRQQKFTQLIADEDFSLRAILGSMVEGVLVANRDLSIRLANERLTKMFSLSRSPVGRTVMEAFRNHVLHQMAQRTVETEAPQYAELPVDIREKDGFVAKQFQVTSVALRPPTRDGIAGILLVFHDVTQVRSLEGVRKDFVANVSHELRTPLSIITGYLETLLEAPPDRAKTRKFLTTMHKHAQRLNLLVDDLLELSRLESRRLPLKFQAVQLRGCVTRALERSDSLINTVGAKVIVDIGDEVPAVEADPVKLEQAIFNLLDNALKYGGKADLEVRISVKCSGSDIIIEVRDNGPGIPLADQPHIFERFYRVHKDRSRDAGGTGLGLSIVKHTVQAHGGTVSLESAPGSGSTFTIRLPGSFSPQARMNS